ncbi:MAG TPA: GtrA family protein [Burkholderiales bacterium]|nr:GtrA family protein [Burkholderiales bacterium]
MAHHGSTPPVSGLYPGPPLNPLWREWLRFIVVGGINTAFGYACYAGCIFAGMGYALASAVSMVAGVLFNYGTTRGLVFRSRAGSLWRFIGCYAVVYVFSVALLAQLDARGVNLYLAGLLVGLPAAVLSYVLLKTLVFRQPRDS